MPTRRTLIRSALFAATAPAWPRLGPPWIEAVQAQEKERTWYHGLSLFGDLKYPAGFKHFDYVNPNAPKGGIVRLTAFGTFDNFNVVVSGVRGVLGAGVGFIHDTLNMSAFDEPSSEYGLLAEAVSFPPDRSSVTYRLRDIAKWHDGKPVTPEDVIFSLEAFKTYHPQLSAYYRHVTKAEQIGPREITFTFDAPGNRELPQIVGQLTVQPKHWWEGTDAAGKKRNIAVTTLERPLGNGAYRIKEFVAGRSVVFERVKDYWGKDLNVNIGRDNFDEIHFDYYRDSTVALEVFKKDQADWRSENSAKNWARAYDFSAVRKKQVILEEFPVRNSGLMQAFAFNIRRDKFKDPRVRRAFNFAFDFEEMNKQMFFGQYKRIDSYFDGLELAATGLPQGEELKILETVRDKVPPEAFTKPYTNPVGGSPQKVRANLRQAIRLMKEAGYVIRNHKMVNGKTGVPFSFEFLTQAPSMERVVLFFKPSLERLGITVQVRTVDDVQYENRLRSWDFDVIIASWGESLSPGNEQRGYWGSHAADVQGSRNLIGIKNPAVDILIDRIIFAKNRAELVATTKALDRVLLWNFYVVPQWTYPFSRTARWDRFAHPPELPKYGVSAFPMIWWWDEARAAKLKEKS